MYEISNQIASQSFDELQVQKLIKTNVFEILCISLEKEAIFPKHSSPTDAQLVVLEGDITFYINGHPINQKNKSISISLKKQYITLLPMRTLSF